MEFHPDNINCIDKKDGREIFVFLNEMKNYLLKNYIGAKG